MNILIIEDDREDADLLIGRWQARVPGCRITLARSYAQAREALHEKREWNCICLDLNLADDPDGMKTLQLIRTKAPGVLILAISGNLTHEQFELFSQIGGVLGIKKGLAFTDLEVIFNLLK